MTGKDLRHKRTAAGISGDVVSRNIGIERSRLCQIEKEYLTPKKEEIDRIASALENLIAAKEKINEFAKEHGWPVEAV
jgi:transcriptional regulator with XRE-family HTH domain